MAHLAVSPAVKRVVGVDGILKALETFASEHPELHIQPADADADADDGLVSYKRFKGTKIELLQGDFFELDDKVTDGRFDLIYDRASQIAIEPSLREKYVETMGKLLEPGGQILLVTLTRPDDEGPPYSTPEAVVRELYEKQPWVESLTVLEHPTGTETKDDGSVWANLAFLIQGK